MFAYFDADGDVMAVTRNMLINQLPLKLQTKLRKEIAEGWITDIIEFATEEETSYYATIESGDYRIWLQNIGSNFWTVTKKVKKD